MGYFTGKKWPCLMLTAYLAVAVTGAFTFSVAKTLYLEDKEIADLHLASRQISENYLASLPLCLAESAFSTGDDGRYSFSSQRAETSRLFMSDGKNSTGSYSNGSFPKALEYYIPTIKESPYLKLRI
jgi:hypothetical protein